MEWRYAMVNWTKRLTQGAFDSVEEARDSVARHVEPGEEWSIQRFPVQGGAGHEVESGCGAIGG